MEQANTYLLEFLERMNRPASFPDRKVARHLSEIFISWMDLTLVAIKINAQPKLYNATQEEYEAFVEASEVRDSQRAKTLSELLGFFENNRSKRHAEVLHLNFHQDNWDELEKTQPFLSKGARTRLCGPEKQKKTRSRELFLYVDFTHAPGIWIELYGAGKLLSSHYNQLSEYCDKIGAYLSGHKIQVNVSDFQLRNIHDELKDSLQLDEMLKIQHTTEPKILLPYVERSMSQMIQIIQRSFEEHGEARIDFSKPTSNQRPILPEFVFSIVIARGVVETESALIPDKLGYLLTASQIHAIRDYLKVQNDRIIAEINRAEFHSADNVLRSLLESSQRINPETWIDRLQEFVLVNVDNLGNPIGSSYGVSSYVVKGQQTEYLTYLRRDPRVGKETNYPDDVRFIEDQFIHGEFLLMIPIFMGGKVAAIFWVTSNIPISPEIRFPIISTVRKYEYLISNAIMMEWRVVRRFVGEKEQKLLSGWLNALEDLAIHPLTRVKRNLSAIAGDTLTHEKNTDDVDFVINIIRFFARPNEEPDKSDRVKLSTIIYDAFDEEKVRKHVALDIRIDHTADPVFHTNRILLTEALRNPIENSYAEALQSSNPCIQIESKMLLDEKAVLLKIWDSGSKFPFHVLKDLFQGRVASSHQGMGVGLNITHLIIKKLGGDIWIDQDDQKTINIKIPL